MKSLLKIGLLSCLMLLGVSCNSGNDPKAVAETFAECIYTADFEKAEEYTSDESIEVVHYLQAMTSKYVDELKETHPDIKVLSSEVNEEKGTAKVKLQIKNYYDLDKKMINPEPETEYYRLKKVDGQWLVVLNGK